MSLRLRWKAEGPYYTDYEVFTRNVLISPVGLRVWKYEEPITVVRQVRPQNGNGIMRWVDLENHVETTNSLEKFFANLYKYLGTEE